MAHAERIAEQQPMASSKCPKRTEWMAALLAASEDRPSATLVSVGCNKADDFALLLRAWSRNSSYRCARAAASGCCFM